MADQPKAKKTKGERNDNRPNRKATKAGKRGGIHTTGAPQSEVQKVLLGGGLLRNAHRREYDKTGHR